jgi:hypothetical protein
MHDKAFASVKAVLVYSVPIAVPIVQFEFLVFTDASESYWRW